MRFILFFGMVILLGGSCLGQIQFSEEALNLGCEDSSFGFGTLGGGISFFDFDGDGWDDLTLSSEEGLPVRFFKNIQGTFQAVSFNMEDTLEETKSVVWVDYDNDSDYDFLSVSNSGGNKLYRNNGDMNFTDVTEDAGLVRPDEQMWGGSWGDYDKDGWLDLFLSSRNIFDDEVYNTLYKNNGDGTFTDVSELAGISTASHVTFCTAFFDYDKDGWQDIYLANDRYDFPNILYKNNGDGTFLDVSEVSGSNVAINAMSTTIGDYNKDGWLDIYVANTPQGNVFLRNNGDGTFTDIAEETGTLMGSIAWGSVFLDADNDADLDLYVSGSQIQENQVSAAFYENLGNGIFNIPTDAGFAMDVSESYGNALGDINNDGYPDIAVLNFEPYAMSLWQNNTDQTNNWLKVRLVGEEGNRQGIGSWIEVSVNGEKQYNYTLCGEGYLGQSSGYEFFGIGEANSIDYVKVTWLSGIETIIENPAINQHLTINEGTILATETSELETEIFIYPNPTKNEVFFELTEAWTSPELEVRDLQGRLLFEGDVIENQGLDVSSFADGTYYLIFTSGNLRSVKKLVLNK